MTTGKSIFGGMVMLLKFRYVISKTSRKDETQEATDKPFLLITPEEVEVQTKVGKREDKRQK